LRSTRYPVVKADVFVHEMLISVEDAATAEISRSQVWQWLRAGKFSRERVLAELAPWRERHPQAAAIFEQVALANDFVEFLTLAAYEYLP